mgnify:FL=1
MSAAEVAYAPLLNVGDSVRIYYRDGYVTENWIEASDVELLDGSTQTAPPAETPDDAILMDGAPQDASDGGTETGAGA